MLNKRRTLDNNEEFFEKKMNYSIFLNYNINHKTFDSEEFFSYNFSHHSTFN